MKKKLSMPMFRRLIYIHQLIEERKYPNCKTLSTDLECSEMTIHRDLTLLTDEFGAPLSFDRLNNGYYYTENFSIPLLETISESEIITLKAAESLLSNYENLPFYNDIKLLIDTLCACGNKKEENNLNLTDRIAVAATPTCLINEKIWNLIKLALSENRVITFQYKNCTWDPELPPERTVRPYQILLENGLCFLFGFLEEKQQVRLYDIRQITNLKILPRHFNLPEDYEFSKNTGGTRFGAFTRFRPKKYKIAFYEDARAIVRNTLWANDQVIEENDEEDCTIITFTSSQDMRVLDWVFENKAYAIPLEPPEFVERWRYNIKVMAQQAGVL